MPNFSYSAAGMSLTESFEGLRLQAYRDCAGVWTIGYGHTGKDVYDGQTISADHAAELLQMDLHVAVAAVNKAVTDTAPINQNKFDALVDFAFNAGCGALVKSELLRCVNRGDVAGAVDQFKLWIHAGGRVVPGLVRRRDAEAALFARAA